MEKLRAYRLRRRIAVPLMLAFSVLWLGTMALLTASTQDRLDITVQRIYKGRPGGAVVLLRGKSGKRAGSGS
mgnify:CR=1 FL=1